MQTALIKRNFYSIIAAKIPFLFNQLMILYHQQPLFCRLKEVIGLIMRDFFILSVKIALSFHPLIQIGDPLADTC